MDMLTVKSALPEGQVALWEKNPDHPEGEVFIAGDGKFQVAPTAEVMFAVQSNRLVIVPGVASAETSASSAKKAGKAQAPAASAPEPEPPTPPADATPA